MRIWNGFLLAGCAMALAGCSANVMTVEQAAMDERISKHFAGQHFGRVFFVDRHAKIDPAAASIATGAKTVRGDGGEGVSVRWATISDADHNLLGLVIGSDDFGADWLEPEMTQNEFRAEWKKCNGERACQDRLIDRALDECDRARTQGGEECREHCWWDSQGEIIRCLI